MLGFELLRESQTQRLRVGLLFGLEPVMSKAAQIPASFIASSASRKSELSPLDPAVLFCGICLLALVVAFAFGEPGLWM